MILQIPLKTTSSAGLWSAFASLALHSRALLLRSVRSLSSLSLSLHISLVSSVLFFFCLSLSSLGFFLPLGLFWSLSLHPFSFSLSLAKTKFYLSLFPHPNNSLIIIIIIISSLVGGDASKTKLGPLVQLSRHIHYEAFRNGQLYLVMEMKERQRWRAEEDALLRAYVQQYGPREWNLVSQRMNTPLNRDAKSCLERWKNYLKPGIKKGSLTEEEQRLVICLQAKHGNKWKKIAAEVPGRTAKRLGKWWEVFKEKQQREQKNNKTVDPVDEGKYDRILETFAEKLVQERAAPSYLMATSNGSYLHTETSSPAPTMLPPWLSNSNVTSNVRPPSPSVTLSLSPTVAPSPPIPWLQPDRGSDNSIVLGNMPHHGSVPVCGENLVISELVECSRELEEVHRAWAAHKKEASWRLRRVELQLESEKACRRREKMEEIEAKVKALREEQKAALDRIEAEYREQLAGLRRDAEAKEQKLTEQWVAKHLRLSKFLDQMGGRPRLAEPNGR